MSSKKHLQLKTKAGKIKKELNTVFDFGSSPFGFVATVLTFLTTLVAIWAIDSAF